MKDRELRASDVARLVVKHRASGWCYEEVGLDGGRLRLDVLEVRHDGRDQLIGYEIKVDRQDFRADEKWPGYLDYCHQLWFVAPKGVITAEDLDSLDPDVGLLRVIERKYPMGVERSKTKRWLSVVRPARRRSMDPRIEASVLYPLIGRRPGKVF